ncbi:hypothetical protein [Nitrosomonas ureae]|uniref:Tape measure domain-containing protein n=1 Tax=Nitrosomonas ureae TaxID=44577 RepID=A0A286ABU5_9PROT|nr:hypothetical protein [Nitrosomonas ureae]SOD19380.1 hypothetical protein SAMN06297164_2365 [Nitrosomonas ureae]
MSIKEFVDIVVGETGAKVVKRSFDDLSESARRASESTNGFKTSQDNCSTSSQIFAFSLKAVGAALATFKLGSLISESARLSQRYNELGIVLDTVGRNAGLLKTEVDATTEAVRKQGISMIESRQVVTRLISSNIDLANATKLARLAQDAAVIGQINSSDALNTLVHGITSAQVEVLRTIGINVNFEQSYAKLAKEMGVTSNALTEQDKLQARLNVVLGQAATLTGVYEASMSNAGKQMRSTERIVEDLKVKVGGLFDTSSSFLVDQYTKTLKSLDDIATKLSGNNGLQLWSDRIAFGLANVADTAIALSGVLKTVFDFSMTGLAQLEALTRLDFAGVKQLGNDFIDSTTQQFSNVHKYKDELAGLIKERDKLAAANDNETASLKKNTQSQTINNVSKSASEKEIKKLADARKQFIDGLQSEIDAVGKDTFQLKAMEAAKLGLTKQATPLIESLKKETNEFNKQQEAAKKLTDDIARIRSLNESVATPQEKLASTKEELDRLRQAGLSAETYNRVLAKTNDELFKVKETGRDVFGSLDQFAIQGARNIQTSLANFLFNPFDDGLEGMVRGVADAVRRMIAEFAAFKILQSSGIASLFNSGFGGGASSSGNSAANFLNIASLGNSLKSGFRSGFGIPSVVGRGLSMLPGSVGAFGAGLAGTGAGVFSAAGGAGTAFIGGAGTAIGGSGMGVAAGLGSSVAAAAGPLAVAAIADVVFRMLAGNKSTGSKIIDSIPVIGSLGALLFGHGPLKFRQEALIGKASGEGFDGRVTDVFRAKGGLFVGNKHHEQASPNEAAFLDLFDNTLKGFGTSVKGFADNLGLSTDSVTNFSKEIDLRSEKGKRLTEEAVQELLDNLGNEIAGGVLAQIDVIAKSGETNIQTLSRLSAEFDVLNTAALSTGRSLKEARDAILSLPATFRTEVVDQLGGVDAASQKIGFFIDNFLSDTEKLKPMFESLDQQMQKLGFSASITRDDFTNLIKSVGSAGGITKDQYIGLLGLIEQFDQVDKLRDKLSQSTNSLVERERNLLDIRNELTSTYQKERSELEGTISKFKDLAGQLRDFRQSLLLGELSPLTPRQKLDEARQQFNEVRLKAATGDQNALAKLPNVAQEFLKARQTYNASSAAFVSDFNLVQSVLKNAEGVALSQVDITTQQLKALDDSALNLVDINQNTKTTTDLVKELVATSLKGAGNPSISTQTIKDYLAANPGLTPQQVGTKAAEFGVSGGQLSAAGYDISKLNQSLGGTSVTDKQIIDFVNANRNNPMAIYNAARANGISSRRLSSVSGIALTDIEKFVRDNGLQSFARGTDFIQKSGLAMVHRAEAIVPSSTTDEIRKLREEIVQLRQEQNEQTGDMIAATDITNKQNAKVIAEALIEVENRRQWNESREPKIA